MLTSGFEPEIATGQQSIRKEGHVDKSKNHLKSVDTSIHCSLIPALVLWASCTISWCPLPWRYPALREHSETLQGHLVEAGGAMNWCCPMHISGIVREPPPCPAPCADHQGLKKRSLLLYFCLPNVTQNISCGKSSPGLIEGKECLEMYYSSSFSGSKKSTRYYHAVS